MPDKVELIPHQRKGNYDAVCSLVTDSGPPTAVCGDIRLVQVCVGAAGVPAVPCVRLREGAARRASRDGAGACEPQREH
jgi:hypothetical protein